MLLLTIAYIALIAGWMLWNGVVATPDYLVLILAPVALLAGRWRAWFTDWVPFVALLLLWEGMRSLADQFAASDVHWGGLRPELRLFGGHLPGLWLQHLAAATPIQGLIDRAAAAIDLMHFPAIVALALVVWLNGRHHFMRYSAAFFTTALAALVVFMLAPTAPPWYAAEHGMIHGLRHVMTQVLPVHWSLVYGSLDPNPVAALPSLHSALPFLGYLALRTVRPRLAWLALAWSGLVWVSVVYLGEHYVVDVVTGVGLASLAWGAVALASGRLAARAAASPVSDAVRAA
jgi:membrane-associated phospholipid phosphatase